MKRCSACRLDKEITDFYRNAAQKDGHGNLCKPCFKETVKQSKKNNPERVRRNRIAYLQRNPERIRELRAKSNQKRRALFPELTRSKALQRYYRDHPNAPCVYLVGVSPAGSGPVKIGHTCNLPKRLTMLQCGSPVRLELLAELPCESKEAAHKKELDLRRSFQEYRVHGEWFSPAPEVLRCLSNSSPAS